MTKLRKWAAAVYEQCRRNWQRAVQDGKISDAKPVGFPGLRKTIREAQQHLVFLQS